MEELNIRIKRLSDKAAIPVKAHSTDAGLDLVAVSCHRERDILTYGTGIALEIPKGYVGLVFPRSSVFKYDLQLTNSVGVIDSGYRGEIMFKYRITMDVYGNVTGHAKAKPKVFEIGERIGQIIFVPYPEVAFTEVDELAPSDRGTTGYGDSGKYALPANG